MGNFNGKNGQQKRKKNNNGYFVRNTQQLGEDFTSKKTARDINKEYRYVFRDIAYSFPDEAKALAKHFLNSTFIYNLNMCAYAEWAKHNAVSIGLQLYIQSEQIIDPAMRLDEALDKAQRSTEAYYTICTHLNNMLSVFEQSIDQEYIMTALESYLQSLSNHLVKFRADI